MARSILILALLVASAAARILVQDEPAVTPVGEMAADSTPQTLVTEGTTADHVVAEPDVPQLMPSSTNANMEPAVSAPKARLRRNSASQAAAALANAVDVRLMAPDVPAPADSPDIDINGNIGKQAICGTNSFVKTTFNTVCRIVATFKTTTQAWSVKCSAAKMGSNLLATAGHCVYSKTMGGYAKSVDVYCSSSTACTTRTTTGTKVITTSRWAGSSTTVPTAWDLAVIRTYNSLPGTAFAPAQYNSAGTATARLSGFPKQNTYSGGCNNAAYNGCTQYSSTDTLTVTSSGLYTSNKMDLCSGHSGGGVISGGTQIVAIVSGESLSGTNCVNNLFAPQINSANVNPTSCERTAGGASLVCLSGKL